MNQNNLSDLIEKLNIFLEEDKLSPEIVENLFQLFENEKILVSVMIHDKYDIEQYYNEFINSRMKYDFFLPLMKRILYEESSIRENFLNETLTRLEHRENIDDVNVINRDPCSEIKILELFFHNMNTDEILQLVNTQKDLFLDILYKIHKKVMWQKNISNLIWKSTKKYSENYVFDYWEWSWELYEIFGEIFSSQIKNTIIKTIEGNDFVEFFFLYNCNYFLGLNKNDIILIFSNSELNIMNYFVENLSDSQITEKINDFDFEEFYEFGLYFPKKIMDYASEHIKAQVKEIAKRKDYDQVRVLIGLELIRFLEKDEIDDLYVDYNYSLHIHWKQGDDLARHLDRYNLDAKKALLSWANELEGNADMIEKLVRMFEGKELEVVDAQVHYITLVGDIKTLEKAVKEKLIEKDEIQIFYES